MTTALDTNILSELWSSSAGTEAEVLAGWKAEGRLVIAGVVYAELAAHPRAGFEFLDRFLDDCNVDVDFDLGAEVWKLAGAVFAAYSERRRRSGGGESKRMLADFIVGAHAALHADRLATLDRGRYAAAFPGLGLIGS